MKNRILGMLAMGLLSGPATAADDVSINVCIAQSCFRAFGAGFDVTVPFSDAGGGGSTGRAAFSALSVVKATDELSPNLLRWAANGVFFPQVVVTVTPKVQLPYTITLHDVAITRFRPTADQATAREAVDFRYRQICVASGGTEQCSEVL